MPSVDQSLAAKEPFSDLACLQYYTAFRCTVLEELFFHFLLIFKGTMQWRQDKYNPRQIRKKGKGSSLLNIL